MTLSFKVCCMLSPQEADMAIAAGAQAVGLVGEMPNGPGTLTDDVIREIAEHVSARHADKIWTTLLTSRIDAAAIADHIADTRVNTVQIVDYPAPGVRKAIRRAHPAVRIIQVVHVEDEGAIEIARRAAEDADVILLDSGKPSASVKTFGGTGDVHDWSVSRKIVESVETPVFLAGGLNPENVGAAIAAVRPFGVDICSGLRDKSNGYTLLHDRLADFAARLANGEGYDA